MAQEVFSSYSSVDSTAGETVCLILEQNGISCWIAPRDITPGLDFAEAIIDGIALVWLFRQQLIVASQEDSGPAMMGAIGKALELDNMQADIHSTMASVNVYGMYDLEGGESAFKKAIEINPNHAEAHALFAHLLNMLGNTEEAMQHGELAIKPDPHNPTVKVWYSQDLLYARRYEEVIAISREIFEKNPKMVIALEALYMALFLTGKYEESLQVMKLHYCETHMIDHNHKHL